MEHEGRTRKKKGGQKGRERERWEREQRNWKMREGRRDWKGDRVKKRREGGRVHVAKANC